MSRYGRNNDYYTGNNFFSRLTKVDFPKFGGDNLRSWLYKVEQFFLLDHTPDFTKTQLASVYLEDRAQQWYYTYVQQRSDVEIGWDDFVAALNARFEQLYDDPMTELKNLRQTGTVKEYHDTFDSIVSRLDLPLAYVLSCFIAGLEDEIQLQVRMFNPHTIQQAYCLAKLQEAALKVKKVKVPVRAALLPNPSNYVPRYQNAGPDQLTLLQLQLQGLK